MANKQILIYSLLLMFSLQFVFAEQLFEPTSLGDFSLPDGTIVSIEDAFVFIAIFVILFAIVLEIFNLVGIMEKTWMKIVSSFIVVLLINFNGLILKIVYFLKDFSNFTNFVSSLNLFNWLVIVLVFCLSVGVIILLRKLVAQWKEDAKKEEKEMQEMKDEKRRKLEEIREKYRNL